MAQHRNPDTRTASILRRVAAAPDEDGIYTTDLLTEEFLATKTGQYDPRQRALTHMGEMLRRLEKAGYVRRTRTGRGAWQRGPTQKWAVTERGLGMIAWWDANPTPPPSTRQQEKAATQERRERTAALIEEYRTTGAGRSCPPWERRIIAGILRSKGCRLQQIGDLFGVTGETIRLDLLPGKRRRGQAAPAPKVLPPKVRRRPGPRPRQFCSGMLAEMDTVTFTEW